MDRVKQLAKRIDSTRRELESAMDLMETVASLDLRDQRPLHNRVRNLRWQLTSLSPNEPG